MDSNSIILSSAGLKNIVSDDSQDIFCFIFSNQELSMHKTYAEFISPEVSRLHQIDPTINSLSINDLFINYSKANSRFLDKIINEKTITYLKQISRGYSIEIDEDQIFNMQVISIFLGNEELFSKISELRPIDSDPENVDNYLEKLQFFYYCSRPFDTNFNYNKVIDFISGHFYSIEEQKLKQLPKSILLAIISNPHLRIESEDSLLDFIQQVLNEDDNENVNNISFYEQIDFLSLSETKFIEFLERFDINDMTNTMWNKFCQCFYFNYYASLCEKNDERYDITDNFESNSNKPKKSIQCNNDKSNLEFNEENRFKGIVYQLLNGSTEEEEDISQKVKVTSSSKFIGSPYNVVMFDDKMKYFMSDEQPNSWVKYDFTSLQIHPTYYSIRTWDNGERGGHLKSWCIEGSNTDLDDDWKLLDSRNNVTSLNSNNAESTFKIQVTLSNDEYFRFIRIRQTEPNVTGCNYLIISALEFFGTTKPI